MSESGTSRFFSEWGPNAGYVDDLYRLYLTDPGLVGESWASYFDSLAGPAAPALPAPVPSGKGNGVAQAEVFVTGGAVPSSSPETQAKVLELIATYRERGHLIAAISPLSFQDVRTPTGDLEISSYGFSDDDLNREFLCSNLCGAERLPLRSIVELLEKTYCGSVGFEYSHLESPEEREWLRERIEGEYFQSEASREEKHRIFERLMVAETFESELHRKYVGQKRFSLQGGETMIPVLESVVRSSGALGVREIVIGMPHRGRLTVLANILGKPLREIFSEFEDQSIFTALGSGDVKYHIGHSSQVDDGSGNLIGIHLASNPSHLEFVHPVVEGVVRAKQDAHYERDRSKVLAVILHGDAAVIGQGIVPEAINLSRVIGYDTGGTFHLVVNNQIGFTTNPVESRSCTYCTDVAKAFQCPIFHVNAEDPEAACRATELALEFRSRFCRDVVIDLYCYRKYGHNEADDPSFTQPRTYSQIKEKESISTVYSKQLLSEGSITGDQIGEITEAYVQRFENAYRNRTGNPIAEGCSLHGRLRIPTPETGVGVETLEHIASKLVTYPESFVPHPKLKKILEKRFEILQKGEKIDWAFAEALAFGSLVLDGVGVRLSGQDCGRGTFSQRHLVLSDYNTGSPFLPLEQLTDETDSGVRYEVYNSPLSEAAVLGFEFGYATQARERLVLWEAQFGDFANGAQVIIDQFIASSEAKWDQLSGVVMLLPHGYEGQGPEHSSARLERFLQLCAEGNMVVCYPTTASQYFHLLRRQGVNSMKRPLIVMTPKSLLRHPEAATAIEELTFGAFHTVLEDSTLDPEKVKNLTFTSGKICYDVRKGLREAENTNTAIIRVEQLSPFPMDEVREVLARYSSAKTFIWCQEEPRNMGSWTYVEHYFHHELGLEMSYAGRPPNASTATGSARRHAMEQKAIVDEVLSLCS